jgi:hypothetical protein
VSANKADLREAVVAAAQVRKSRSREQRREEIKKTLEVWRDINLQLTVGNIDYAEKLRLARQAELERIYEHREITNPDHDGVIVNWQIFRIPLSCIPPEQAHAAVERAAKTLSMLDAELPA